MRQTFLARRARIVSRAFFIEKFNEKIGYFTKKFSDL